uniref:Uncharacterized protein n=1 Tax=Plectus sambesii TaxID=2011161 RepID=A0A914VE48_9BILA
MGADGVIPILAVFIGNFTIVGKIGSLLDAFSARPSHYDYRQLVSQPVNEKGAMRQIRQYSTPPPTITVHYHTANASYWLVVQAIRQNGQTCTFREGDLLVAGDVAAAWGERRGLSLRVSIGDRDRDRRRLAPVDSVSSSLDFSSFPNDSTSSSYASTHAASHKVV